MIAFIIWSICAGIFVLIGISTWRKKDEAGFFTGVKPPKMKDITAYNHAVAKIWFVFAALYELAGIPLGFIEQNSPIALLIVGIVVLLIIGMMIAYMKVEQKYRKK